MSADPALLKQDWEVVMGTRQRVFTRDEMRIAVIALLTAAALAIFGMIIQDMIGPSLGPWGAEPAVDSLPGVLDAQPIS